MFRVGFCISGSGRLFRAAVENAEQLGIQPKIAVLDTNASEELDTFCQEHGVDAIRLRAGSREQVGEEITTILRACDLDLVCLTFNRLIPADCVDHYAGRMINLHPGLLPAFAGMHAIQRAADSGARYMGATMHEVDHGMDTGAIIAQCVLGIHAAETAERLGGRLYAYMRLMYLQVIAWYAAGRVHKDKSGRIWVSDAHYGDFPISPSVEQAFLR